MTQKVFNSSEQLTSQVLLLPKQYPDEAMMSSFQTPANSSFTYPRIMVHNIYSPKIVLNEHQNKGHQCAKNVLTMFA